MTMDHGMCNIETGTSINIKRTDGRVHSAIVSGVNWEQRSVTVEWFEKGETKGKEVEIDAILALNPELTPKSMPPPQMNNMLSSTRGRDSSGEEDEGVDELENPEDGSLGRHGGHTARNGLTSATLPVRVTSRLSHSTSRPSIPVKAGSNRQISRQVTGSRPTNIMPPAINGHSDTVTGLTGRREAENIPPTPTLPSNLTSSSLNKQKQIQQPQQPAPPPPQPVAAQQPAQVENGRGRRSNVVKEVERLKKNREERRQRQAELKEEKEALMNLDPGNPNWEFLAMIREYQNSIDFRPLRESDSVEDHQITVCVRKRPLNRKELNRKEVDVISVPSKDQMVVHEPKAKVDLTKYLENQLFRFDYAFDETCNNEIVYKYTAKPLVQTIFEGGMATCFAYGQTGSGKTHTMGGDFNGKTQDCKKGVYAMVAKDVFKCLKSAKYRPLNLVISASFFEIYSGKVFDLLADKEKLRVLEDGKQQVQIVGLTEKVVETCDEVLKLIQHGNSARTSGQTSANSNSSRSHAVFQIIARTPSTHKVHGKFSLIDLAGNERGADTSSANRQTRMEGAEINKSLLALKECIRALGRKGTHLPFRASKLTQVLRDSFIGEKSRTCMIAMISPGMSSCEHSLNTLRYADRVKELAATDPTEMKVSPSDDERSLKIEDRANNSALSDSDLAQLRSMNEGEISQDLLTFHEAVSALQLLEEEVLDTHKAVMDNTNRFLNGAHSVFTATHEVDYDQEDTRAKRRSHVISTLNRPWNAELGAAFDTTITSSEATDTGSVHSKNDNLPFELTMTTQSGNRSPWQYDTRGSSSSSSTVSSVDCQLKIPKNSNKTRRHSTHSLSSKKTFLSKNSAVKTTSARRKSSCTPRSKRSVTTEKKNDSKYTWKGTFNDQRARRTIFSDESTTTRYDYEANKSPRVIDSRTRSPSPVDEKLFYSDDSEIEARVFGLNKTRPPIPSCCQDRYDNQCYDQDPRRCSEHSIEDPDVGECNNVQSRERIYSHRDDDKFYGRESDRTSDYFSYDNNDLIIKTRQKHPDERRSSRFGSELRKLSRASVGSNSSTVISSGGSTRCKSNKKSSLRRVSLKDIKVIAKTIESEDEVFEVDNDNIEIDDKKFEIDDQKFEIDDQKFEIDDGKFGEENEKFCDEINENSGVYTTTANLWVTGEPMETSKENIQNSTSRFRSLFRCFGNFFLILLKNIVLLSILPTVYIAFFIYVQTRQDEESF